MENPICGIYEWINTIEVSAQQATGVLKHRQETTHNHIVQVDRWKNITTATHHDWCKFIEFSILQFSLSLCGMINEWPLAGWMAHCATNSTPRLHNSLEYRLARRQLIHLLHIHCLIIYLWLNWTASRPHSHSHTNIFYYFYFYILHPCGMRVFAILHGNGLRVLLSHVRSCSRCRRWLSILKIVHEVYIYWFIMSVPSVVRAMHIGLVLSSHTHSTHTQPTQVTAAAVCLFICARFLPCTLFDCLTTHPPLHSGPSSPYCVRTVRRLIAYCHGQS